MASDHSSLGPIPLPNPGQRASGYFPFADEPMLSEYRWPYFAISGVSPGKTILIVAGSHAGEYAGIEACIRLGRTLDPAQVRGSIIILPLLNVPGFFQRSLYVNPVDGKNMNRQFPGDPQGTWSQRFAFHLFEKVVAPCHYLVDIHDGDLVEDLSPLRSL